jgi:hypothetical protein
VIGSKDVAEGFVDRKQVWNERSRMNFCEGERRLCFVGRGVAIRLVKSALLLALIQAMPILDVI